MSLFSKKPKEEAKEVNEEPRDDYIVFGTMTYLKDNSTLTMSKEFYNATFEEMLVKVGNIVTIDINQGAFIVQQFMTLKEHNEMIDSNRRKKHLDK